MSYDRMGKRNMQFVSGFTGGGAGLDGSDYDGTNDFLDRGGQLTGGADGKQGTVCFSVNVDTDGVFSTIVNSGDLQRWTVFRQNDNKWKMNGWTSGGTKILEMFWATVHVASDGWITLTASWDLSVPVLHAYRGDSSDKQQFTLTDNTLDYLENDNWNVGAKNSGEKFDGQLSEFWFDDTFYDISIQATRRNFVESDGLVADALYDLTSPLIHLKAGDEVNDGTGGAFTEVGSLVSVAGPRG